MTDSQKIAGIVLAGGRSLRMGQNKALLDYKGQPLVQHMLDLLRGFGVADVFVSGSVKGYPCIEDEQVYMGPAQAACSVIRQKPDYDGYLFVPVDMPLLTPEILFSLRCLKQGGYFMDWPLPAYIARPFTPAEDLSMQGLLSKNGIQPVPLPKRFTSYMINANTPDEWDKIKESE